MDVTMPDGTVINGVPEGFTKSQLLAKYQKYAAPAPPSLTDAFVKGAYSPFKPIVDNSLEALKSAATATGEAISEPLNSPTAEGAMAIPDAIVRTVGKAGNAIGGAGQALFSPVTGSLTASAEPLIPAEAQGIAALTGQNPDLTPEQIHQLAMQQGGDLAATVGLGMAANQGAAMARAKAGLPPVEPPANPLSPMIEAVKNSDPKKFLESTASGGADVLPTPKSVAQNPMTYEGLKENSNNLFKEAEVFGGGFSPKLGENISMTAQNMKDTGFRGELRPEAKAFNSKLDYYSRADTSDMSLADFQKIDKDLNRDISAYNRAGEYDYARQLNDFKYKIRDMVKDPEYIVGSPQGIEAAQQATAEWHRALKMKDLERIKENASKTLNPKTSIQTQLKNLSMNENKMRGWTPEEVSALNYAQKTGVLPGLTNLVASKLINSVAGGLAGAGGGVGGTIAGAVAGNALGSGAAKLAGELQARRTGNLANAIVDSKGGMKESMNPQAIKIIERVKKTQEAAKPIPPKPHGKHVYFNKGGHVKSNLTAEFLAIRKRA